MLAGSVRIAFLYSLVCVFPIRAETEGCYAEALYVRAQQCALFLLGSLKHGAQMLLYL